MKHKKKRFAALMMSVIVGVTAVPSWTSAEDFLFTQENEAAPVIIESNEEFIFEPVIEEPIPEEAPQQEYQQVNEEAPAPQEYYEVYDVEPEASPEYEVTDSDQLVGDSSPAYVVDPSSIEFYYQNWYERTDAEGTPVQPLYPDGTVTYTRYTADEHQVELDTKGEPVIHTAMAVVEDRWPERRDFTSNAAYEEAVCENPLYVMFKITLDNHVYHSGNTEDYSTWFQEEERRYHSYESEPENSESGRYVDIDSFPTCTEPGTGHIAYKCTHCGKVMDNHDPITDPILDELQPLGHLMSEPKVRYENLVNIQLDDAGNIVFDLDGIPELADVTKDGYYTLVTYRTCMRDCCNAPNEIYEEIDSSENKVVFAKKIIRAVITETEDIADTSEIGLGSEDLVGWVYFDNGTYNIPDHLKIELENCDESGWYKVEFYTKDPKPVSERWFEVEPHHLPMETRIEFDTVDDRNQCEVVYDDEHHTYSIKNKSCYKTITYYEVSHCTAAGCPNAVCPQDEDGQYYTCEYQDLHEIGRVRKTVAPEGPHIYNTVVYNKYYGYVVNDEYVDYDELVEDAENIDCFMEITENNATCTEDGLVTISFKCKLCKDVIKTLTVKTEKLGHDRLAPIDENMVEPTCESEGSYDAVIYCGRCGEELYRRTGVRIPRLKHTNELSVYTNDAGQDVGVDDTDNTLKNPTKIQFNGRIVIDQNGSLKAGSKGVRIGTVFGADTYAQDYFVYANRYTECSTCKGTPHKVILNDEVEIEVVGITDQDYTTCMPGSITLKADDTTESFPYYTSINEYMRGTGNHNPGQPVRENEVPATATSAGSYDEVVYCLTCNKELSRKHVITAHDHVPGEAVKENNVEATCTKAGSYEEVIKCTLCGQEISRTKVTVPAKNHDLEYIPAKEPTTTETGNVAYYKCKVCGALFMGSDASVPVTLAQVTRAKLTPAVTATPVPTATPTPVPEPTATPVVADKVPAKVMGLETVAQPGRNQIKVSFKKAANAKDYQISYKEADDATYTTVRTGGKTTFILKNLERGGRYTIRVRGINGSRYGKYSSYSHRWLEKAAIRVKKNGTRSVRVTLKTTAEGADLYQVRYSRNSDMTSSKAASITNGQYKVIKNLTAKKTYYFTVRPYIIYDAVTYIGAVSTVKSCSLK